MSGQVRCIAAFDYSMSCPCLCINESNSYKFFYVTSKKKYINSFTLPNMTFFGIEYPDHKSNIERFDLLSNLLIDKIKVKVDEIRFEGYSFGSKGQVFDLAENTGMMKYKLYKDGYPIVVVPPTVIKKFATGKGNANKEAMYSAWSKINPSLFDLFGVKESKTKIPSPINDIVDAYYLSNMNL